MQIKHIRLFLTSFVILAFAAAVFAWPGENGRLILQKMATDCAMPYGITWLGLFFACVLAWRNQRRSLRVLCLTLLLIHTLAGNGLLSNYLALSLERPYEKLQPLQEKPFDKIVVLGGGTSEARNGRAQADRNGERVVLAARMYHAGLTKAIVCTGQRISSFGGDQLGPAEEAAEILAGLGVPATHIEQIGGVNTIAEMRILAKTIEPWDRVGLITSAWHMSRALRLAQAEGLQFVPLPADFITDYQIELTPFELIPTSHAAADNKTLLREYLARVFRR